MIEIDSPAAAPVEVADLPWQPNTSVTSSIHILATEPVVEFGPRTYPSLTFFDRAGYANETRVDITLIGTAEQRTAFVASLRAVADSIEAWTEADGAFPDDDESAVPA